MFKTWDWNDTWQAIGVLAVLLLGSIGGAYVFADKEVDYYYVSAASRAQQFCVYAHWTWHSDEIAYCSDDKDKVLDFVVKANATIKKH